MLKTLRFHEHGPHGATYVRQYTSSEMGEIFLPAQLDALNRGEMIIKGGNTSVVDLEAFFIANNRFGVSK